MEKPEELVVALAHAKVISFPSSLTRELGSAIFVICSSLLVWERQRGSYESEYIISRVGVKFLRSCVFFY